MRRCHPGIKLSKSNMFDRKCIGINRQQKLYLYWAKWYMKSKVQAICRMAFPVFNHQLGFYLWGSILEKIFEPVTWFAAWVAWIFYMKKQSRVQFTEDGILMSELVLILSLEMNEDELISCEDSVFYINIYVADLEWIRPLK